MTASLSKMSRIILSLSLVLLASLVRGQEHASAQNATAFALVYGYPLLAFQKYANRFLQYNVSNLLYHARELSTADNRTVVRPNVDTLYSAILYDISHADLAFQIPEIASDQFALFSFYDIFGDNYANFGSGGFQQEGNYLLQRPLNGTDQLGVVPRTSGSASSKFVADVYSPGDYGVVLIRWLVNSTNIDLVHQLQDQTKISTTDRTDIGDAPALTSLNTPAIVSEGMPAKQVLELLAAYEKWNPPQALETHLEVSEQLEAAGIQESDYTAPADIDLETANSSALASISASATNASNIANLNNGWSITPLGLAGSFNNGTEYAYRATVAASGFLMLQAPIAIYPSWTNASDPDQTSDDGSFDLGADEAWVYTFSRKPPLQSSGFWSMTVYADNYLVPNNLNRYALGDRSNITYPDGSLVYEQGLSHADDTFQVIVQAANVLPPRNWTNNWIPAPAGGGSIGVWLRFYLAQDELLDGTYQYPTVEKRAAIKDSDSNTEQSPSPTSSGGVSGTPSSIPVSTGSASSVKMCSALISSYGIVMLAVLVGIMRVT